MPFATTGTCEYNGVAFGPLIKSKVSSKPVFDEAGRTVQYIAYTLEVTAYIGGTGSDATLATARAALLAPGAALSYTGKGFGTLVANTGGVSDVNWGPKPEILDFIPIGNNQTALITWRCTTCVPECSGARYTGIMAAAYEANFNIDQDGYTTRTISGFLEIAQSRNGRAVTAVADTYREQVTPDVPVGFQRVSQEFRNNKSKSRLDYTFVDKEIPVPLPDGATGADITHRVEGTSKKGFNLWTNTISGTITMAKGQPKTAGFMKFLAIILDRLSHARSLSGPTVSLAFSVEESIFGRTDRYSYTYTTCGSLVEILTKSGIWEPVPGTSFGSWKTSLANSAFHPRGAARLTLQPTDDAIVDLCGGTLARPTAGQGAAASGISPTALTGGSTGDPANTWLAYENTLIVEQDNRKALHVPLRPSGAALPGSGGAGVNPTGSVGSVASSTTSSITSTNGGGTPHLVQQVSDPIVRVRMIGQALRVKHDIPIPVLTSIGGVEVKEEDRDVQSGVRGADGMGQAIKWADWNIVYLVPKLPQGGIPALVNPQLKTNGGTI